MSMSSLWKKLRRHIRPLLLMIVLLPILAIPELENAWIKDPCALQESEQGYLTNLLYLRLSNVAFHFRENQGPRVTIVYIDPKTDPPDLLTNTCRARDFLAHLVEDVTSLDARAIVIDKFYSRDSCAEDKTNMAFKKALGASAAHVVKGSQEPVHVVVGRPTHLLTGGDKATGACLALSDQFDFGDAKIKYGLTRLNSDVLKIPIYWPIFKEHKNPDEAQPDIPPTPSDETTGDGDTLSVVAATQIDPSLHENASFQQLMARKRNPYTNFLELPKNTAMAVRCHVEKTIPDKDGKDLCKNVFNPPDHTPPQNVDLAGKVVIIGDLSDQDMQPFPDTEKERPGVYLQANYIQSLLDHRYLRQVPFFITVIGLALFIIAVYCLHWSGTPEHALWVSSIALLAIVVVSLVALVSFQYYTPLWAISGAGLFVLFRYLETRAHHSIVEAIEEDSHSPD
jgi:CHASE2 domain